VLNHTYLHVRSKMVSHVHVTSHMHQHSGVTWRRHTVIISIKMPYLSLSLLMMLETQHCSPHYITHINPTHCASLAIPPHLPSILGPLCLPCLQPGAGAAQGAHLVGGAGSGARRGRWVPLAAGCCSVRACRPPLTPGARPGRLCPCCSCALPACHCYELCTALQIQTALPACAAPCCAVPRCPPTLVQA
jgi:hypothetical protein